METYKVQLIQTFLVIAGYLIVYYINKGFVNNSLKQTHVQRGRRKMIIRSVQLLSFITAIVLLGAIWGVQQDDIAVFIGAILTALGIAFFAQWSLLSNVTSSVLLFFNHPMRIGDTIKILDKDFPYEGEISDLTYFFVHIKTANKEIITVPNSLLLQKAILIVEQDDASRSNSL